MSWKDKARESQNSRPDFLKKVDLRLTVKENEKGNPAFVYYDRESQENVFLETPVKGTIIGDAMKVSSYGSEFGRNGMTFATSIFCGYSDKGAIYGGGDVLRVTGRDYDGKVFPDMGSLVEWLGVYTGATVKKRKVFYVVTEKGKLVEIETNMTLGIENFSRKSNIDFTAVITPCLYDPTDYNQKTVNLLKKVAIKNPPKYAKIEYTDEPTPEDDRIEELYNKYIEYREYVSQKSEEPTKKEQVKATENVYNTNAFEEPNTAPNAPIKEEDSDDLPF